MIDYQPLVASNLHYYYEIMNIPLFLQYFSATVTPEQPLMIYPKGKQPNLLSFGNRSRINRSTSN